MAIVGGLDIHRRQITYDYLDTDTGQVGHGRIQPATRVELRAWLAQVAGRQADFAIEGTTGFANSRQAVRFTGLDITVAASDTKRARGHLARQGPPVLRWALHEAAMCAARPGSPDHAYYLQVQTRLGGKRAALSVARKLAREAYHTPRTLGDQALAPVVLQPAA
jgi:Transposase IS116/IS110/IS902 family